MTYVDAPVLMHWMQHKLVLDLYAYLGGMVLLLRRWRCRFTCMRCKMNLGVDGGVDI